MELIRFHLDEHIAGAIARGLRRRGVDVTTTAEEGLLTITDEQQLEYAVLHGRVMVTHDVDYLILHAQGIRHTGICYCHQDKYSVGELIRALMLVRDCVLPTEMINHIEYL